VLGVVPFIPRLRIADEDSVSLEGRQESRCAARTDVDIAVIRLPRISNYDDFTPLEHEPGVVVRFVDTPQAARDADIAVLPGSKCTALDLEWLRTMAIAEVIEKRARNGEPVLGICGGCQMLGQSIEDPHRVESNHTMTRGLGLLPLRTRFQPTKTTAQITARIARRSFLSGSATSDEALRGYEIHMGLVEQVGEAAAPFAITSRNGVTMDVRDGAIDDSGMVVGTMIHGIFDNGSVRGALLDFLRRRKGVASRATNVASIDDEYDRVEQVVRQSIDCALLWRITGLR
jgi:adenosylcobyric acid synthase